MLLSFGPRPLDELRRHSERQEDHKTAAISHVILALL